MKESICRVNWSLLHLVVGPPVYVALGALIYPHVRAMSTLAGFWVLPIEWFLGFTIAAIYLAVVLWIFSWRKYQNERHNS